MTVTYERDFDLLERLLVSIEHHLQTEYQHYIILNDDVSFMPELNNILARFSNKFVVIHYEEFKEMHVPEIVNCRFGARTHHGGWFRQIILTLLAATKITTPYYLHLCSKDSFVDRFNINDVIQGNKFLANIENFKYSEPHDAEFNNYFLNAYKLFGLDPEQYRQTTIGPRTPAILNTQQVQDMITDLTENNLHLIDLIGDPAAWGKGRNKTVEYYLYSAWLTKNNLIDDTVMWGQFTHRTFKTGPTTYDLRRATE